MSHDEIAEVLGAYALDALDHDERATIERHLVSCARCRAEVHDHRETAALLAHTGGDAPSGIWADIAGALDQAPPTLRLVPAAPGAEARPSRGDPGHLRPRLAAVALTAAAAVIALLGVQVQQQDHRIEELRAALSDPLVLAFEAALEAPSSRLVELSSSDGRTVLPAAITSDGVGYLRAAGLPELRPGRTYQLWGAAGDQLVSLGVLGADPGVITFRATPYDAFAITEEDAPGVVVSRGLPVVAGGLE